MRRGVAKPGNPEEATMTVTRILLAAPGTEGGRSAIETALLLARRFGAHVEAVNVGRNPRDAVAFMTEGMTGAMIEEIIATAERDIGRLAATAAADLQEVAARLGLAFAPAAAAERAGEPPAADTAGDRGENRVVFRQQLGREDEVIAERGRLSDLVVAPRPAGDAREEVVAEAVLMESGSGLLLVPPGHASDLAGNAAIAWNGSAEAARAVHRALPLLKESREVAIMAPEEGSMRGPGPEALAAYLALHGIRCHVHRLPTNWTHIGETLMATAREENASFIVMGAFSQGKLRQLILGGATRFMLNHAQLPVLFTH